ncbi:MAG TPA: hypothetical protein VEI97_06030 [bacterium]|nr:hypothetical protein [bacterium]
MPKWLIALGVAVLFLAPGCDLNDDGGNNNLDATDFPLNPLNNAQAASNAANWTNQVVEILRDVARVAADSNVDRLDDCLTVQEAPSSRVEMTFDECGAEQVRSSGTVEIDAIDNNTTTVEFDLLLDPVQPGVPAMNMTGTTTLTLEDVGQANAMVRQEGNIRLQARQSQMTLQTDLRFPVSVLDEADPNPTGTVRISTQTLARQDVVILVTVNGTNNYSVNVNGQTSTITPGGS